MPLPSSDFIREEVFMNPMEYQGRGPGGKVSRSAEIRKKRDAVKLGLALCLGATVITGMGGSKTSRRLHVIAGAALVGLSAWHHLLYTPKGKKSP